MYEVVHIDLAHFQAWRPHLFPPRAQYSRILQWRQWC